MQSVEDELPKSKCENEIIIQHIKGREFNRARMKKIKFSWTKNTIKKWGEKSVWRGQRKKSHFGRKRFLRFIFASIANNFSSRDLNSWNEFVSRFWKNFSSRFVSKFKFAIEKRETIQSGKSKPLFHTAPRRVERY